MMQLLNDINDLLTPPKKKGSKPFAVYHRECVKCHEYFKTTKKTHRGRVCNNCITEHTKKRRKDLMEVKV